MQNQFYDHEKYSLKKLQVLRKRAAHLAKPKEGKTADVVPAGQTTRRAHETRQYPPTFARDMRVRKASLWVSWSVRLMLCSFSDFGTNG